MKDTNTLLTNCQEFRWTLEKQIMDFEKHIGGKIDHITIHNGSIEKFDVKFGKITVHAGAEKLKF